MSLYGYAKETTPAMKSLCKTYKCLSIVARANAPYTKASFKSIMTGLLPFTKGGYHSIRGLPNIAKTLLKHGYKTLGFPNNAVLSSTFGFNDGFLLFVDPINSEEKTGSLSLSLRRTFSTSSLKGGTIYKALYLIPRHIKTLALSLYARGKQLYPYIPSHSLISPISKIIRENNKDNFFIWLHLMDSHYPYFFMPEFYEELYGEKSNEYRYFMHWTLILNELIYGTGIEEKFLDYIRMFYTASIRTVDDAILKLINELEKLNILNNSILIVTADHGEEFFEHGAFGHVGKRYISHMYEELLKVPLIIIDFSDKVLDKKIISHLKSVELSHIDLYPTLCSLIGLKSPVNIDGIDLSCIDGNSASCKKFFRKPRTLISEASLFNANRGYIRIPLDERIVIAVKYGAMKYISYDVGNKELYNLENDPSERFNLIGKATVKELEYLREVVLRRLKYVKTTLLLNEKLGTLRRSLKLQK